MRDLWAVCANCGEMVYGFNMLKKQNYFRKTNHSYSHRHEFVCNECNGKLI